MNGKEEKNENKTIKEWKKNKKNITERKRDYKKE